MLGSAAKVWLGWIAFHPQALQVTSSLTEGCCVLLLLSLGNGFGRPVRRGEPDLLRGERGGECFIICDLIASSMGERTWRSVRLGARGEGSFETFCAVAPFLPLAWGSSSYLGSFPVGQRGRICLNSERPELPVNKVSEMKLR